MRRCMILMGFDAEVCDFGGFRYGGDDFDEFRCGYLILIGFVQGCVILVSFDEEVYDFDVFR